MHAGSLLICAILVAAGLARGDAVAQPAQSGVAPPAWQSLALVTGEDYPPFADPTLPGGGLATQLVQKVVAVIGGTATLDYLPWRRGYEEALRGRYDATFPYVKTPERERDYLYSESLFHVRQVLFMATDRAFPFHDADDLRGRRVCFALGYAPQAALQVLIAQGQIERITPNTAAACPGLVAAGRADFFIQDERIGGALVARMGLPAQITMVRDPPFGSTDLYFIVPRRRPGAADLIARFNTGLARVRASGAYDRLLAE